MALQTSFVYENRTIDVEWHEIASVSELPKVPWNQIYAVGELDGKVPIVYYEDGHKNLPGGRTESGESIEETLHREIAEELNCRVLSWVPIGYQKLIDPIEPQPLYQLRVYAKLERIGKFSKDPGGNVIGHTLVDLSEVNGLVKHGSVGERIVAIAQSLSDT